METAPDKPSGAAVQILALQRRFQTILDQTTPYHYQRWAATAGLLLLYFIRVWIISAYYIVTYALGIYLLNLFLGFLQPKFDPAADLDGEDEEDKEAPGLPTQNDDEFKPFIRRLPEFKFWYVPWDLGKKSYGGGGGGKASGSPNKSKD
ncbi:retention in endoplasmic reticulum protein 1 [Irineochytrium annulatum]|nr:retention in endoplasmic reticulum protein 1 [Irineochytrium annulatum]